MNVIENEQIRREFGAMPPVELSIEFLSLWNEMPNDLNPDYRQIDEATEDMRTLRTPFDQTSLMRKTEAIQQQRLQSQEFKNWSQRMEILLSFAKITPSFRLFIIRDMRKQYVLGMNHITDWETFYRPKPQNDGVFSEDFAKELDRKGYLLELRLYKIQLGIATMAKQMTAKVVASEFELVDEELMRNWRQEFIDRYHEEP